MPNIKTHIKKVHPKHRNHHKVIDNKTIEKIKKEVAKEFPYDEALQQVHIARKIISYEAKQKNMSLIEFVKSEVKKS